MHDCYEQLSFIPEVAEVTCIGGVEAKILDIQQHLVNGIGNYYGTTLRVQTIKPLPVDEPYLTITGSKEEVLNGAQFYIGNMYYKPGAYYIYSLVGVRLLPRI